MTSWVECSIYGKRGEAVAPYITKGAQIGISGEALLRLWEAKDGSKGTALECRVHDVTLLGTKAASHVDDSASRPASAPSHTSAFDDFENDLPF